MRLAIVGRTQTMTQLLYMTRPVHVNKRNLFSIYIFERSLSCLGLARSYLITKHILVWNGLPIYIYNRVIIPTNTDIDRSLPHTLALKTYS